MVHDLRLAFRHLRRRPGFALLVISTLALAVGANVAVFTFCHALLRRPLPLPERLMRIRAVKAGERAHLAQRETVGTSLAAGPLDRSLRLGQGLSKG